MRVARFAALAALALGCDDDAPGAAPETTDGLPGEPLAVTTYTPAGCVHRVSAPDSLVEFTRGDTATLGAAPTPTNVHVTWPAAPTSTIAMLWQTDPATRATVVQYGTAPDRLDRTATGHAMTARSLFGDSSGHEVHVCGLAPDTTYYYRVGAEGHWSAVQSFKTAPAPGGSGYDVNFAVSGDSRDDFRVLRAVQARMLSSAGARQPDFEVFTGDAVPLGPVQSSWDGWFEGVAPTTARMPFVMAHGNHEALSVNYLMQFALPQAGSIEQDELYYSFDYGPVHFVVINDTPYRADYEGGLQGTQRAWLRADLTAHRARRREVPWLVAVHHKAPFSSSNHVDDFDTVIVRRTLPPLYEEFGVDVVFNGHDHDFEISKELDGQGREVTGRRGTVYFVSGGAGAGLYGTGASPWKRYAESVTNFLLVRATSTTFEVVPHRGDGTVIAEGRLRLTPRQP